MTPRCETKYIISAEHAHTLDAWLESMTIADPHNLKTGYPILSVYYDTQSHDYYHEKIDGEFYHRKARLRTYGLDTLKGPSFFEIKYKYHDDGYKKRVCLSESEVSSIEELGSLMQFGDAENRMLLGSRPIYPVCCVFYRRKAYKCLTSNGMIRLNLDTQICWRSSGFNSLYDQHHLLFPNGEVVLEIKAPHRRHLDKIMDVLIMGGERRTTFSKYISCMNLAYSTQLMETPHGF